MVMKHLKYIALILFVWLGAACEQLPLPNTELTIKSEIVTEVTANSAVIEVEFNPTAATIQNVYACYTSTEKTVMEKVADLKYRVNLLALDNNTEYHVHYMVTNSFSSVTLQNNLSFTTAVNKPSNLIDTVYHIDFTQTMGAWTIKNYLLSGELTYVWRKQDLYGMTASAYVAGTNHASEAWLISSPLDLTSNTTAFLTFNQAYKYGDISQFAVKITTNGLDWTTLEVPVWPDGTSWSVINSGEIDITKYISATTQIAYAYTSSAEASPTWEIRDVLIKGNGTRIEEPAASVTAPTVVTSAVTQIAETTAVAGGNVTSDGGASVTERGVVYSTSANQTTANSKRISGSGTGSFTCNLYDLQPNTTYYVRAYAKNDVGIAYGDEVSFTTKEEVIATPEYVDLGLSVNWATFNVGANKPEDYGDYFAWGETEPKSTYDWSNYKWCRGSETTLTKYCNHSGYGTVDNKTTLELSDDVAAVNWGGKWRMPTTDEMYELKDQCTWTWTTLNGVNGYEVTSNSNGNSIFLPAAGIRYNSGLYNEGSNGEYLLSSQFPFTPGAGRSVSLGSGTVYIGGSDRSHGLSVRPVYGDVVDLGELPTISTLSVTNITETTAVAGVNITSDGGTEILHRGVVYNTHPNPTISDSDEEDSYSGGIGSFTFNLTGLQPNTTYYVRAFASNSKGYVYGEEVSFTTQTQIEKPTTPYFSVSQTKYITFSPGNLQYHPANNEWRFAPSQLDYIGDANSNCSSTYNGWLDLFGWSTSATNFGVSTSEDDKDYSGSFVDWGTNTIGNDAPNTWRTLTEDEWEYLLNTRPNASSLKGVAQVNGVNGLILLPDNWVCPAGVTFKSGFHSSDGADYYAAYQTFTDDQWSKLEAAGAVFLPAAGYRVGSNVNDLQSRGRYRSATEYDSYYAYFLYFYSGGANMRYGNRSRGQSVRLVKDL